MTVWPGARSAPGRAPKANSMKLRLHDLRPTADALHISVGDFGIAVSVSADGTAYVEVLVGNTSVITRSVNNYGVDDLDVGADFELEIGDALHEHATGSVKN